MLPLYSFEGTLKSVILDRIPNLYVRLEDKVPIFPHAFHVGTGRGEEGA